MVVRIFILSLVLLLFFCTSEVQAQGAPIRLNNPSFIDIPHAGGSDINRGPRGWQDCGAPGETPPDVQPNPDIAFGEPGYFDVTMKAQHEGTYMGMVVRDNDTQEAVSQRLTTPLEAGKCYELTMYLARSPKYISQSRKALQPVNYTEPIKIRIYGGSGYCMKTELLDETPLVKNTSWKQYKLRFEPTTNHRFILIQAFYKTPTLLPYNGNVLVDNLSDIVPVLCDETAEPIAAVTKPPKREKVKPEPKKEEPIVVAPPIAPTQGNAAEPATPVKKEKIVKELDKKVRLGQIIKLKKLIFGMDQAELNEEAYEELDEIQVFLRANPTVKIEVRGHTNDRCDTSFCNELSQKRAQSVVSYLVSKGIPKEQLTAKGYGKTKPVASNRYSAGRKKNQRVELKIVEVDS